MIKNSTVVNRPIEEVFDYAAQFERHPEWQPDLKSSTLHGEAKVGATGSDTREMGKRVVSYDWEVTDLTRPTRIAFRTLTGPVRPVGQMVFTPDSDGTRVDFEMSMNPRGLMKLLGGRIDKEVNEANVGHLANFKSLLEAGKT